MMLLVVLGVGLWMLGGYRWKGWRRFVWPVAASVLLLLSGLPWYWAILVGVSTWGVNTLHYGDKYPLRDTVLAFTALTLPCAWISPWLAIATVATALWIMVPMYLLSRRYNWATWKVVEATAGLVQALSFVWAMGART